MVEVASGCCRELFVQNCFYSYVRIRNPSNCCLKFNVAVSVIYICLKLQFVFLILLPCRDKSTVNSLGYVLRINSINDIPA
jgi:hypothetical protein